MFTKLANCALGVLSLIDTVIYGFNIDTIHPILRTGPPGSYFGFSIAQHFANEKPTLLVGAPRAHSGQPGTHEAGAIFLCRLDFDLSDFTTASANSCTQVQMEYATSAEFREPPQRLNSKILHAEGKNHQLLGFVVKSTGERYGNAMACAPLLRYGQNAYTDGACYVLSTELNHTGVISTCNPLPKKDRHNDYGACEQGFSGYLDKNVILTGLPGARKWTGGVFGRYEFTSNGFPDTVDHWTMEVSKEQNGVINVLTSHDYLGYSVAYGRFGFWYEKSDDSSFTIVSGATRFQQTGGVVFLPFRRHTHADEQHLLGLDDNFTIAGEQLGGGFGAALLVLDLNADGFDDLIVSAPYEFFYDEDLEYGGAIYIFYSAGKSQSRGANARIFLPAVVIRGESAHSQFGLALTRLGNIDNDAHNYEDFAVGAPQADDGRGAVFIFHGGPRESLSATAAQVIRAKTLPLFDAPKSEKKATAQKQTRKQRKNQLRNFGAALAGAVDMDGNGYGELAVGAFASNTVVLFRTRSVIDVKLNHLFAQKYIKIDDRRLASCPTSARNCFTVTTTLQVIDRNNTSDVLNESDAAEEPFTCQLELIPYAKAVPTRGLFIHRNQTSITWPCGRQALRQPQQREHQLYVPQSNQDWTNALRFNFTVRMLDRSGASEDERATLQPIVNQLQSEHVYDISFDKKCGDDNDCHTDLALSAILLNMTRRNDGMYVTKVTERDVIVIRFVVENRGERAFYAKLFIRYDADELDEPQKLQQKTSVDVERKEHGLAVLSLGNPLEENKKLSFDLSFNLVRGSSERVSASLSFSAHVNSTSLETNTDDNTWNAEVQLIKEADLQLDGASRPLIVRFSNGNPSAVDEVDIGAEVIHVYTLTNHGPFYARNVTVTINWPLRLNSERGVDDWALYTLEEPVIRHNGEVRKCVTASTPFIGVGFDVRLAGGVGRSSSTNAAGAINPLNVYNDETLRLTYEPNYRLNARRQRTRTKRNAAEQEEDGGGEVVDEPTNKKEEELSLLEMIFGRKRASSSEAEFASIFDGSFLKPKEIQEASGSRIRIGDVNCKEHTAICVPIICHFDYVGTSESASIEIRSRLWNYTFANDYKSIEYFALTSDAFVEVDAAQGILENIENNFARVSTHAYPDRPAQDDRLTWWMLALAALAGLLLLGILILVCGRCGFFKRKRDEMHMHKALYKHENEEFFG